MRQPSTTEMVRRLERLAESGGQRIEGLGRMTADDNGVVRLQFASEESAQAFMCDFAPSVELDAMPDIPAKVGGDEREALIDAIEAMACPSTHNCSNPELFEQGYATAQATAANLARAALSADGGERKDATAAARDVPRPVGKHLRHRVVERKPVGVGGRVRARRVTTLPTVAP